MTRAVDELWSVAQGTPYIDANALAAAIESAAASEEPLDYRTRLLIRDSLSALQSQWGKNRFERWLFASSVHEKIERARDPRYFDSDPAEVGFPSLPYRVMEPTTPQVIAQFFRELSRLVRRPTQLTVGGSLALILRGLLSRRTEDADVVNEVPSDLRDQHDALHDLLRRFGLQLTHFQSHYLPQGWEKRIQLFQSFGDLDVYLVDAYDVMVSKLCSKRAKDLDDLRAMESQFDRNLLADRLKDSAATLLAEQPLCEAATHNWYILFGEDLPA
jgi:hypothetical protein